MFFKKGFYKVDHDYVMNSAKVALSKGCSQFHLVSSTGADKNSMFLYPKTKVTACNCFVKILIS